MGESKASAYKRQFKLPKVGRKKKKTQKYDEIENFLFFLMQ